MDNKFPCPIVSEKDLNSYSEYIKNNRAKEVKHDNLIVTKIGHNMAERPMSHATLEGYLNSQIGKIVRVESLIGNCLERRVGTLVNVGNNYIVIKLYQGCSTMVCEASSIKYITVIHDNDLNKAGLY